MYHAVDILPTMPVLKDEFRKSKVIEYFAKLSIYFDTWRLNLIVGKC